MEDIAGQPGGLSALRRTRLIAGVGTDKRPVASVEGKAGLFFFAEEKRDVSDLLGWYG